MKSLDELLKIKNELLENGDLPIEDFIDWDFLLELVESHIETVKSKRKSKLFKLKVHYFKCNDCEEITLIEKTPLVNPLYSCPNCMEPMEHMDDITVVQED
jgi:hypothetical protein